MIRKNKFRVIIISMVIIISVIGLIIYTILNGEEVYQGTFVKADIIMDI